MLKEKFIKYHIRDKHYDFSEHMVIPGLIDNIGCYTGKMPWFYNTCFLILLDIIVLGWLQRLIMLAKTGKTAFTVRKYIIR